MQRVEAFTDVTDGSNEGCKTIGFLALCGWDVASVRELFGSRSLENLP